MSCVRFSVYVLIFVVIALCPQSALSAVDRNLEIQEAVTAFVATRTSSMGWDVHLRRINIPSSLKLPDGVIDYEIVAPQKWEGWGSITLTVLARQKNRLLRNMLVEVDVEALADTVVAVHEIKNGSTIVADDLALQKRKLEQGSHLGFRSIDEAVGKKARTIIQANQPVRTDQIEIIPLIKSGQMVTIIVEKGVFKLSVTGKARRSGVAGDFIEVQNLTSHKEIKAKVIDESTVQVPF
jgi:flagella basal body P-ring formation protein FlgA